MKGIYLGTVSEPLKSAVETIIELRRCARCKEYKSLHTSFYQNPNTKKFRCYCHDCHSLRYQEYRKANPELIHDVQVRRWQKIKSNPELHAYIAELRRINRRLGREGQVKNTSVRLVPQDKRLFLNKEPIVKEIEARMKVIGTLEAVAKRYGLCSRTLRRVLKENEDITFWLADEICIGFGMFIYNLYPELLDAA